MVTYSPPSSSLVTLGGADIADFAALNPTAGDANKLVTVVGANDYGLVERAVVADAPGTAAAGDGAHIAAADPHIQYQRESEKDVVGGYTSYPAAPAEGKVLGYSGGVLAWVAVAALLASPAVVEGVSWQELFVEGYGPDLNTPTVVETPTWSA